MDKKAAVIILNYNTPNHTAACVLSFITFCDQNLFDIIVVDNGSTDGSLAQLRSRLSGVIFIDNLQNLGFADGNNQALGYSVKNGYEYSLLINSDTLVNEDIVTPLIAHLNHYAICCAVQPAIYWMHNRDKLWNGPGYYNPYTGNTVTKTAEKIKSLNQYLKVDWVSGCCILLRNNALQMAGLFNKKFFLYYEDVELSFRLRRYNFELHYLPTVKIYHEAGVSGKSMQAGKEGFLNPQIHYYLSRNHLWFLRKYASPLAVTFNIISNTVYYAALWLYFKLRRRNKKAQFVFTGIKEGLFTPKKAIWPTA